MGQWTRVENSNEVFLRVTNHTGQAEKNLLEHRTSNRRSRVRIPAGPSRFFSACPVWFVTRRNTSLLNIILYPNHIFTTTRTVFFTVHVSVKTQHYTAKTRHGKQQTWKRRQRTQLNKTTSVFQVSFYTLYLLREI